MTSLEENKTICKSCKGTNHKRSTNRLCPNSRWQKEREADRIATRIANTDRLIRKLKIFEDFIVQKNITMHNLAQVLCSKWTDSVHYHGNSDDWKLDYYLKKKLIELHYDVASAAYGCYLDENYILNAVSMWTKKLSVSLDQVLETHGTAKHIM